MIEGKESDEIIDLVSRMFGIIYQGEKMQDANLVLLDSRLRVLWRLNSMGNPRMGELAAALGIAVPSLTGMIKKMEEEDLLERRKDPVDSRAVRICMSALGRRKFEAFYMDRQKKVDMLLSGLEGGERTKLIGLLKEVYELLNRANSKTSSGKPSGVGPLTERKA